MTFRNLDVNNDWTFGQGLSNYVDKNLEIALNLQTRLYSFLNDCFFDLQAGIDWFNLIGYNQEDNLLSAIRGVIVDTPDVTAINNIDIVHSSDRNIQISYDINTTYTSNLQNVIQGAINV